MRSREKRGVLQVHLNKCTLKRNYTLSCSTAVYVHLLSRNFVYTGKENWGSRGRCMEHCWHQETWALMLILYRMWGKSLSISGLCQMESVACAISVNRTVRLESGALGFNTVIVAKMLYAFGTDTLIFFLLTSSFLNWKYYYC